MERSQLGNPLYRKHDDGHLLQVLETCTFFLYLQILSTNIQFILLHKFEMHTSRTCYCFSCWSFAMPNWPPCSIFLCFCSRTTVYSNRSCFLWIFSTVTILGLHCVLLPPNFTQHFAFACYIVLLLYFALFSKHLF